MFGGYMLNISETNLFPLGLFAPSLPPSFHLFPKGWNAATIAWH